MLQRQLAALDRVCNEIWVYFISAELQILICEHGMGGQRDEEMKVSMEIEMLLLMGQFFLVW